MSTVDSSLKICSLSYSWSIYFANKINAIGNKVRCHDLENIPNIQTYINYSLFFFSQSPESFPLEAWKPARSPSCCCCCCCPPSNTSPLSTIHHHCHRHHHKTVNILRCSASLSGHVRVCLVDEDLLCMTKVCDEVMVLMCVLRTQTPTRRWIQQAEDNSNYVLLQLWSAVCIVPQCTINFKKENERRLPQQRRRRTK